MTQEEARKYAKEYREDGFGRIVDKRYYMKHRDRILERMRMNYRKKLRNTCESE